VKRLRKILLAVLLLAVLAVAAGGWAIDRWLKSPAGHARVEAEISRALKMPLKLGRLGFSSWSGLSVEGISVPSADGNFFEARSLSVEHKFSSLVRGRIVLGEVRLVEPRLRWIQSPDGQWRLPALPAPAVANVAPAPPATPPQAVPAPSPGSPDKRPEILIKRIAIVGGSAELLDAKRTPVAAVSGLDVTLRDASEISSSGEIAVAAVSFPGYVAASAIKASTAHRDRTFAVQSFVADICKGRVSGEFTVAADAPASARINMENVNLGLAGPVARSRMRNASGILSGDAELGGITGDAKTLTGRGSLLLKSGRCTEIELIRQIGEVLQYAVLAGFEVREASAKFRIASERVTLEPFDVSLHPLGMAVAGTVAFDGTVDMEGALSAPADIVGRTGLVGAQFSPPDAAGRQPVKFDIRGSLDDPKQNLAERLTGTKDRKWQRVIAAESILSTLLGRKGEKAKAETPKVEAPAPAPQPRP
jgi:uncharacterized protein involved in outer membrane biogenesis